MSRKLGSRMFLRCVGARSSTRARPARATSDRWRRSRPRRGSSPRRANRSPGVPSPMPSCAILPTIAMCARVLLSRSCRASRCRRPDASPCLARSVDQLQHALLEIAVLRLGGDRGGRAVRRRTGSSPCLARAHPARRQSWLPGMPSRHAATATRGAHLRDRIGERLDGGHDALERCLQTGVATTERAGAGGRTLGSRRPSRPCRDRCHRRPCRERPRHPRPRSGLHGGAARR